jgi:hypothetical protein
MNDVYLSPTLGYLTLAGMPGGFEAWVVQLSPLSLSVLKRYGSAASHHRQEGVYHAMQLSQVAQLAEASRYLRDSWTFESSPESLMGGGE